MCRYVWGHIHALERTRRITRSDRWQMSVFEKGKWDANYRLRKTLKISSVPKGIAQVSKDIFIEVYMQ